MKLPNQIQYATNGINTCTLAGISLLWGQMLGMLNPWFTPLTVFVLMIGYGSEANVKLLVDKYGNK